MSDRIPPRAVDEHDRARIAEVAPSDWVNPTPKDRYHLVVVGAGTAGLVSAAGATGLGAKVALVERHQMGGDCLNVGCVPSKGVIRAARSWHEARRSAADFGGPRADGDGDFAAAMTRMRRLRAGISPVDGAKRFAELGVDVFLGHGKFVSRDTVEVGEVGEVGGAKLRFRRAVVATGARAGAPPIPGLEDAGYRTNETLFDLEKRPRRLVVIGAGPIGCEMAQSFARFGSEVTVLDAGEHMLPREDPDAARIVQAALERDGVRYVPNAKVLEVTRDDGTRRIRYAVGGAEQVVEVDELLVAAGRAPNVEGLGLEAAGVEYDRSGVPVDAKLRTSNRRIFAAGDVVPGYQFTHLADAHARIVIQNALFAPTAKTSGLVVPWCTYTSPELAHVGLHARDAAAQGLEIDTFEVPLDDVDRAILDGDDEGFLRVHVKKGSDTIVGATLVAAHAGDMIGELCLAITHGLGLGKIAGTIHPYPTQGEVIRKAANAWQRTRLTPTAEGLFRRWFKLTS